MTAVERQQRGDIQPLGDRHNNCVHGAEGEVCVLFNEVRGPNVVGFKGIYNRVLPEGEAAEESGFAGNTSLCRKCETSPSTTDGIRIFPR